MSLFQSIGSYDNLDEPTPFFAKKAAIYGFVITFLTISSISASLRLFIRFFVSRCPGWDDYFIILIFALTWVTNVGSLFLVKHGLGTHFALMTISQMEDFIYMFWWCNACYNMSMAAIKLSLLFQYLRLLSDHPGSESAQPKLLRIAIYVLIVITSIWGIIYSVLAWVPCVPVYADWDFTASASRYGYGSDDKDVFAQTFMIHGACNMAIDVAIFSLPLFSRSMWATAGRARQSRIAMLSLYILGIISVVCSIYRFVSIVQHKAATSPTFDPTWYGATAIVLSIIEVDIATTMASLPVFWPYLRRNIDRIMITHEVEVKVTEQHHHDNDDSTTLNGRPSYSKSGGSGLDNRRLSRKGGFQLDHTAYTPWMDSDEGMAKSSSGGRDGSSLGGLGKGGVGLSLGASAAISDVTNTKAGEVVMMRDLGRSTTNNTDDINDNANMISKKMSNDSGNRYRNHSNSSSPGNMDLPFDGTRMSPEPRSPNRVAFLTRNSKEGLLH